MILTDLGSLTAYRMHTPKWATAPTSGAGAATHGGRANRPGTQALYLALEADTAVREYQQVSPLMPPGTLVSYTVSAKAVVDFRRGYDSAAWSPLWEEFDCDWREGSTSASSRPAGCWPTKLWPQEPKASCSDRGSCRVASTWCSTTRRCVPKTR